MVDGQTTSHGYRDLAMKQHDYLFLGILGIFVILVIALFEQVPGYMDADYYLASGNQLAAGEGFVEPFLWNYLDDPEGLPHPSHTYWMPLVSILAGLVPGITGLSSWWAARIPFLLAAACLPPLTAYLAYSLTVRRSLAITSGLLAVFSGFYLPFLPTTDTFTLYILLGGLFFVVLSKQFSRENPSFLIPLLLGLLAGLMHLTRADGLLWLAIALSANYLSPGIRSGKKPIILKLFTCFSATMLGYLLIMGPWFVRNALTFGSILAPGGLKMLWLTSYNQIFSYPASEISFASWINSGAAAIMNARAWSLGLNLATTLAVQGGIILFPFIIVGIRQLRHAKVITIAILAWSLTLAAMTLAFPYAGARGGFFHSGAALQTIWWVLAPIGLEAVIHWFSSRRKWEEKKAQATLRAGMVGMTILISLVVLNMRLPGWGDEALNNQTLHTFLEQSGAKPGDVVIAANPPGFFLVSSHPCIALPDGTAETIIALAERYHARYLILEEGSITSGLQVVYDAPEEFSQFDYLGEVEEARVFAIVP
jgi:hypothetical protein